MSKCHIRDAGQTKAAAQHRTFQHGNHCLRRRIDLPQHSTKAAVVIRHRIFARRRLGLGRTSAGHVLDVTTGTEMPAGTAQNHRADAAVVGNRREGVDNLLQQRRAHRIARLRPVEGHVQHAAFALVQQVFCFG